MSDSSRSSLIHDAIQPLRQRLLDHPLYGDLAELADLRVFLEYHVYAVWDFMSLLKALQRELTCVSLPWVPAGSPETRMLINQIVLGEESDRAQDGRVCSHFELYLEAMAESQADTGGISAFIQSIIAGATVEQALEKHEVPPCVSAFVKDTFGFIHQGRVHEIAAAFTYGREDLIPGVFGEIVSGIAAAEPGRLDIFRYYLERHIELDGDEHGELGRQMVASLCGDDDTKWQQAATAAQEALAARLRLWDGIHAAIVEQRSTATAG